MAFVDPATAAWLKSEGRVALSPGLTSWGSRAVSTEQKSTLADALDAQAECNQQADFLGPPRAAEVLDVPGLRYDLLGRVVTLRADRGGYGAGLTVLVIGVQEQDEVERTRLWVLRRFV